jgi:hypothetical protein
MSSVQRVPSCARFAVLTHAQWYRQLGMDELAIGDPQGSP